jgi:hypothetical protein
VKLDDIMAAAPAPSEENATKIPAFVDFLMEADDLPDSERAPFITGYLLGMTYVLAQSNEGKVSEAALQMLRQQAYWQGKGWI